MQVSINNIASMNTNVIGKTSVASMEINGFTFQALSGKNLYKNVIRAIVRELSCNALDAHVMAGTQDRPFDIHIPTALEPYFSVRDYGVGLDDDGVRNVYLTYFKSTKRNDNSQIGAWGLGSKSPLGYTDNFTVTAVKDGIERIYSVFKNEDGIPAISIICENSTDKHNGLEIQMAMVDADTVAFKNEALEVFKWFDVKPNFNIDMNFVEDDYLVKGMGGNINIGNGLVNSVVVHGNIAYSLDGSMLNLSYDNIIRKLIAHGIELHMPHGSVEYSMSREELSYTKSTIDNIVQAIDKSMGDLVNSLAATLGGRTPFEAYIMVEGLKHKSFISRECYHALSKSGISPLHEMPNDHFDVETACRNMGVKLYAKRHRRGWGRFECEQMDWAYPTNVVGHNFMVNDETSQSKFDKKLKHNINRLNSKIIVIPPAALEEYSKLLADKIGYTVEAKSSSMLEAPPKKVSVSAGARKDVVYRSLEKHDSSRSYYSSYKYRFEKSGTTDEPTSDNKYYVALKGMTCEKMTASRIWELCEQLGVSTHHVYGVSSVNVKKLSKDWVDLFTHFEKETKKLLKQFKKHGSRYDVADCIMEYIDTIEQFDDVTLLRKATDNDALNPLKHNTLIRACTQFGITDKALSSVKDFNQSVDDCVDKLLTKYALLNVRDNGRCNFKEHMVQYIKMVNQL